MNVMTYKNFNYLFYTNSKFFTCIRLDFFLNNVNLKKNVLEFCAKSSLYFRSTY